jgi:hypothetical protein
MLSDDMDISEPTETPPLQQITIPLKTPPHYYKAVRIRKKTAHSSKKLRSIVLSLNPP